MRSPLHSPWICLALALSGLHMLVFDRGLGGDGWAPFAALTSIVEDGDLALENNTRGVMNGLVPDAGGHLAMQYPPGILLLDALPFAAGRALDAVLPTSILAHGAELPPAGRVPRGAFLSAALIVLARNGAVLLGLLALGAGLLRSGISPRLTALALALTFFGGPLLFYSLVGMTHAPAFALAALLFYLLTPLGEPASLQRSVLAGLAIGAAILIRFGSCALAAPAVFALLLPPVRAETTRLRRALTFSAGLIVPLLLLPLWWRMNFGGGGAPGGYGGSWQVTLASPWNVLLSPRHGLFLFHPATALAVIGLLVLVRREARERRWGWGAIGLVWFLGVATLHGWWSEWPNEGGYGQRFLIDALPALGAGFAAFLAAGRGRGVRLGAVALATAFGFVLFFGAVGGLVVPPAGLPWPQRVSEYRVLVEAPPDGAALAGAARKSSFLLRGLFRSP